MKRTSLAVLPAVAVFALTGCTADAHPASAPAYSSAPMTALASPSATAEAMENTAWAEQIRKQFLASYDRTSVSQFSDGTPHQKISRWYETSPGSLLVELSGDDWPGARLRWLAIEIIDRAEPDGKRLGKVTVATKHHHNSRTVTPHYVRG